MNTLQEMTLWEKKSDGGQSDVFLVNYPDGSQRIRKHYYADKLGGESKILEILTNYHTIQNKLSHQLGTITSKLNFNFSTVKCDNNGELVTIKNEVETISLSILNIGSANDMRQGSVIGSRESIYTKEIDYIPGDTLSSLSMHPLKHLELDKLVLNTLRSIYGGSNREQHLHRNNIKYNYDITTKTLHLIITDISSDILLFVSSRGKDKLTERVKYYIKCMFSS